MIRNVLFLLIIRLMQQLWPLACAISKVPGVQVRGVDLSEGMLEIGRQKVKEKGLDRVIELVKGDSERIVFADHTFDAATVAFGVRNFENLEQGLVELFRVIKPGGHLFVLEFSKPKQFPYKQGYNFYFKHIQQHQQRRKPHSDT